MSTHRDVVIVGAGPVGLMLATELRRQGTTVVVLEQLAAATGESRASQLNARTMEILDERDLLTDLNDAPRETMGHFGGLPVPVDGAASPYAGLWKVPQFQTEEILGRRAAQAGATVLRSCRFLAVSEVEGGLEVTVAGPAGERKLRCQYLVGCDGSGSRVRAAAGIDFAGQAARRRLLRADVGGITVRNRRFEQTPRCLAVAARRPDGVTRIMVHEFGARQPAPPPDFADLLAVWTRVTGEDIGHGRPLWVDAFDDEARQAVQYRRSRILIAGDAAHQHMPIGGQALNLGLQDAVNLGWKLAAVIAGRAGEQLLDTYHAERHPVAAAVIQNVSAQAVLQLGGPEVGPIRELLTEVLALPAAREQIVAGLSGLDVCYPVALNRPAGPAGALLGRRLPHLPVRVEGASRSTGHLLRTGKPVLLVLSGPRRAALEAAWRPWAGQIELISARVNPGTALSDVDAVLIRPDGHLVWAVGDESADRVEQARFRAAVERWFTAPDHSDYQSAPLTDRSTV